MSDSWLLIVLLVPVALCSLFLWHSNRQLLEESLSLKKQLQQATEKLHKSSASDQEKTQFLARMSHDIRTHLNVMLGFAQLQKSQIPLDSPSELTRNNNEVLAAGWKLLKYLGEVVDLASLDNAERSRPDTNIGSAGPAYLTEVKYSPRNGANKRAIKIVYIENEQASTDLIKAIADLLPEVTVFTSSSIEDGLKIAHYRKPDFFLLDVDDDTADITGSARILHDAKHFSHTPLVAISADLQPKNTERLVQAGFSQFLSKPIKVDDLINIVRAIQDQCTTTKEDVDERTASGSI